MNFYEKVLQLLQQIIAQGGGGGGGGDASAANQIAVQANAGSDASEAVSIQGITGGKAISVSGNFASQADVSEIRNRLMPPGTQTSYVGISNGVNLKSSAGSVYSFSCTNLNAGIRYFQLFDTAGSPSGTPIASFPVYGNSGFLTVGQDLIGGDGIVFSVGVAWGFSTTPLTYTAATATDAIVQVRWS